jgi:aryl-alcohol dehydrogenase-like predicted oxidoreductase
MIAKDQFGKTGHASSRAILGGAALGSVSEADADRALETAFSYGVNHIDTAAGYGESELRIGDWIRRHGKTFFLATKTGARAAEAAGEKIRRSLERLQVPQVDLVQLHCLIDPAEWETAMGPGGALEAAVQAQNEGLVRFIGVTGHGVGVAAMHLQSLNRFGFDSVLLPYSYVMMRNPQYRSDFEELLRVCRDRGVAVQTIKSICRAPYGERKQTRSIWYEPLEEQDDIDLAVHWVLAREGIFLDTVGDVNVLPRVLDAADRFSGAPAEDRMEALFSRAEMQPLFT